MPVTNYMWDEENDTLLMETDEAGNTIAEYTHEPGRYGPLISQRRNGHTYYHHYDGQGSTRALTDESGNVTDRYTYTAFGELVSSSGTTTNPFGYKGALGYYANPETNELYIRARSYQPTVGRWHSIDRLITLPVLRSLSPNTYAYAWNRPTVLDDPSGLWAAERLSTDYKVRSCYGCGDFSLDVNIKVPPAAEGEKKAFAIIQRLCFVRVVTFCEDDERGCCVEGDSKATPDDCCFYEFLGIHNSGALVGDWWNADYFAGKSTDPNCLSRGFIGNYSKICAFRHPEVDINKGGTWHRARPYSCPGKIAGPFRFEVGPIFVSNKQPEEAPIWWDKFTYEGSADLIMGWNCCPERDRNRSTLACFTADDGKTTCPKCWLPPAVSRVPRRA